jgi:hypothetical protein
MSAVGWMESVGILADNWPVSLASAAGRPCDVDVELKQRHALGRTSSKW